MTVDLFGRSPDHDPGGKVRYGLPAGLSGDAEFSPCGVYRPVLRRWTGPQFPLDHYALWIGMNPSTAAALVNDPTCAREWAFTASWGLSAYVKCNVSDYRSTNPKDLLKLPAAAMQSPQNLDTILRWATGARRIVLCHGKLNAALAPLGADLVRALRSTGLEIWTLGQNADGSPKHPLYLKGDTPLHRFIAGAA